MKRTGGAGRDKPKSEVPAKTPEARSIAQWAAGVIDWQRWKLGLRANDWNTKSSLDELSIIMAHRADDIVAYAIDLEAWDRKTKVSEINPFDPAVWFRIGWACARETFNFSPMEKIFDHRTTYFKPKLHERFVEMSLGFRAEWLAACQAALLRRSINGIKADTISKDKRN